MISQRKYHKKRGRPKKILTNINSDDGNEEKSPTVKVTKKAWSAKKK